MTEKTNLRPLESSECLLTATEAARRMGVSPYIVKQLCKERQLEAYRILNQWRISPIQLERYMLKNLNVAR